MWQTPAPNARTFPVTAPVHTANGGRSGAERRRWAGAFGLSEEQLVWFRIHEAADLEHSDAGWNTIARYARELHMEDAVVEACRRNLLVWTLYFDGIAKAGDELERGVTVP